MVEKVPSSSPGHLENELFLIGFGFPSSETLSIRDYLVCDQEISTVLYYIITVITFKISMKLL